MHNITNNSVSSPQLIRDGVYGATIQINQELIHLRMERITQENEKDWSQFRQMSVRTSQESRGVLSVLVLWAGTENYPSYEEAKDITGFTEEEFRNFTDKAIAVKNTSKKITDLLNHNSIGTAHMWTYFTPDEKHYIVYATKNPNFEITGKTKEYSLKNFIQSYGDILISVGSDFSDTKTSFENRGISRNPWWVFENKYAGLSMILHGFSATVADKFYQDKSVLRVKPVGSMQNLIVKNLQPGEGYIENAGKRTDITDLKVSNTDPEGYMNYIKTSALVRIYNKAINPNGEKITSN